MTTRPIPFEDPTPPGVTGRTVFIRCSVFGSDCSPPEVQPPDVFVVADETEDQVTSVNGVDPTPVASGRAFATIFREARGVVRIQIFKATTDLIRWQLRFRNPAANGSRSLRLMWVVADTLAESQQPWITAHTSSPVLLDARPGEPVTASLQLENHGTGLLVVSDQVGAATTPGLAVSEVPPPLPVNSCATMRLTFTGQAQPASSRIDWTIPSNDTTGVTKRSDDVDEEPTHTGRVELVVTSHPRMPVLNGGDIVLVDSTNILRIDPPTGLQTVVASGGLAHWAWDVAVETSGNLLFTTHDSLVRIDRRSGSLRVVSAGGALENARSMVVAADGSVLVVNSADGHITRIDPNTGAQSEIFTPVGMSGGPIALGPDGSLFMSASQPFEGVDTATLVRIHLPTGAVTPILRKLGFGLEGVAVAPDGAVFVVANTFFHEQHQLVRVDPQSGTATTVFNRPDILLNRVIVTSSGAPLVTGRTWPNPDPFEGQLLRLSPAVGDGEWPVTPMSVGKLLRSPDGLFVVPAAPG